MPTDFERDLRTVLHRLTPEPPDQLRPPGLAELFDRRAGAAVVELAPAAEHPPTRRRWPAILAAASVAALIAGVVAAIHLGNTGHPATPTPGGAVPQCGENEFVMEDGSPLARRGNSGTTQFSWDNQGPKPCAASSPSVSITVALGAEPTGGWRFPVNAQPVQIPGHGRVVFTAYVRVAGRCRTAKDGELRIDVTHRATTVSWSLGVTGCTLTPLRLTHRVG